MVSPFSSPRKTHPRSPDGDRGKCLGEALPLGPLATSLQVWKPPSHKPDHCPVSKPGDPERGLGAPLALYEFGSEKPSRPRGVSGNLDQGKEVKSAPKMETKGQVATQPAVEALAGASSKALPPAEHPQWHRSAHESGLAAT